MLSYYDLILALIPLVLGGVSGVLSFIGLSLTQAVPIAATLAVALILHAMFVRAPVSAAPRAGPNTAVVEAGTD